MLDHFRPAPELCEPRAMLSGFTPAELRIAYGFAQASHEYGRAAEGAGITIAIVDAENDPAIEYDLAVYDHRYGLRPANLTIVNLGVAGNTGGQTGWSQEIALDGEIEHALLPMANLVIVEAAGDTLPDLAAAERVAEAISGVDVISNSWGAVDSAFAAPYNTTFDAAFVDAHAVVAAAAGDSSGQLSYPAEVPGVVAVGGTVLSHDATGYHQRPWLRYTAGSGNTAKPGPDVRIIGGPPGLRVFGTSGFGKSTWTDVWGTSLSCPAFCAVVGAADGVRLARREIPLGTAEVLAGLIPDETPTVPGFIQQFT